MGGWGQAVTVWCGRTSSSHALPSRVLLDQQNLSDSGCCCWNNRSLRDLASSALGSGFSLGLREWWICADLGKGGNLRRILRGKSPDLIMFFLHFQRLRVIWTHIRRQGSASVAMTDGETGYTHYMILFVALQELCQRLHGSEFSLLWLYQYQNSEVFVNAKTS
ncbi:hypothetical protein ABKV19_008819 [Rosa sericea]